VVTPTEDASVGADLHQHRLGNWGEPDLQRSVAGRRADLALAGALFGQRLAEERRWDEAMTRFAELERRFPSSEWALRAKKARADILLGRGHPFRARAIYRELAAAADPVASQKQHNV